MKGGCKILWLLVLAGVSVGCEKELRMDYRSIEPLTVIEGYISNEEARVVVTVTRDMADSVKTPCVEDAVVTISGSDESFSVLEYSDDGCYISPSGMTGTPGVTYTLQVMRAGQTYSSQSEMQNAPAIAEAGFYRFNLMNIDMLLYVVDVEDIAGEENYYCYKMYHNDELYQWNVMNDKSNPDDTLTVTIACMDEEIARPDMDEDEGMFMSEGDEITFELQAIDVNTYNYLYSLGVSGMASSNPVYNFTGGGLGYFSAYNVTRTAAVFHHDEILDWEVRDKSAPSP